MEQLTRRRGWDTKANSNLSRDRALWEWSNQTTSSTPQITKVHIADDYWAKTHLARQDSNLLWRLVGCILLIPQFTLSLRVRRYQLGSVNQPSDQAVTGCSLCGNWTDCFSFDRHSKYLLRKDKSCINFQSDKANLDRCSLDLNEANEHHTQKDG